MNNSKDGWIPVVGNQRKTNTFRGYKNLNFGGKGENQSFTLFIDNLPEFTSQAWLRNSSPNLALLGIIPQKRSKVTGRRFGFVRYDCEVVADLAISKSNGLWMDDRKLFVKFACFDQIMKDKDANSNKDSGENVAHGINKRRENLTFPCAESSLRGEMGGGKVSYDQVLHGFTKDGMHTGARPDILKLDPSGNEWLYRSVVAKLHKFMEVDDISRDFEKENINETLIRSMGEISSLL